MRQPGIFGQLVWDCYTVGLLGFRTTPNASRKSITAKLDHAALTLLGAFPFLTGQVVKEGRSTTNSGMYCIVPYAPHDGRSPVRVKDCSDLCPSYDEIMQANAPFSMLDGDILCPMKGMGYRYDERTVQPVFIVQANFIHGGLLLCFASMHQALDMNGQAVLIRLFAAAARGEELDPEMVAMGNRDANGIVPPLKNDEVALEHEEFRQPSSLTPSAPPPHLEPGTAPWKYWRFRRDKLIELKTLAAESSPLVSTNDAVTAFYLQRLTTARIDAGRLDKTDEVRCLRAVDARRSLVPSVPEGYLGHLVALGVTELPAAKVQQEALSSVAGAIRQSILKVDDHYVRSLATLIANTADKTTIFYTARLRPGKDVCVSSWAQIKIENFDLGEPLGKPDFFRRPRLSEVPDLAYIMPRTKDGDMDLATSLFRDDVSGLQNDAVWMKYVEFIG
ncbi:hypothetical protein LTR67_009115 [Exophiala xenobiotica]